MLVTAETAGVPLLAMAATLAPRAEPPEWVVSLPVVPEVSAVTGLVAQVAT